MGPLEGIRVVEFAGLGPGPFCGMLLSDMGAEVIPSTGRQTSETVSRASHRATFWRGDVSRSRSTSRAPTVSKPSCASSRKPTRSSRAFAQA